MLQPHVVEVSGTFVGAAAMAITGFRFRAVHLKVEDLVRSTWRSLDQIKGAVLTTGQASALRAAVAIAPLQRAARSLLPASATGATSWI